MFDLAVLRRQFRWSGRNSGRASQRPHRAGTHLRLKDVDKEGRLLFELLDAAAKVHDEPRHALRGLGEIILKRVHHLASGDQAGRGSPRAHGQVPGPFGMARLEQLGRREEKVVLCQRCARREMEGGEPPRKDVRTDRARPYGCLPGEARGRAQFQKRGQTSWTRGEREEGACDASRGRLMRRLCGGSTHELLLRIDDHALSLFQLVLDGARSA